MILALRADGPVTELVLLQAGGRELDRERWESGRQLSVQLLEHIQQLLSCHQHSWKALTGLIVFQGPGSFTGLRIGITVANTIAYAQDIPIVGTSGDDWVIAGVRRLRAGETDEQVQPIYGAEAHVTQPRHGSPPA